ncbi:MAG: N-acetylglucosamine-6-phosphate deacetylase [Rubrobacteraceae bacterium]|nr:N-acetylglucosamine-6-phosphate deacetylase [Rubrobacteraceae bacterium]
MSVLALRGRVVAGREVLEDAWVLVEGGVIRALGGGPFEADETVEVPDCFLVPGFVDLQVNGAFGVDVATEPERLGELSAKLLSTGTTSYLPTVVSRPLGEYAALLSRLTLGGDGAEPLGVHLEGPFLNPQKRGAHPEENLSAPDAAALSEMLEAAPVRLITLAPELPGADALVELAVERRVTVSLGHSDADYVTARRAFDLGARGATHLFNTMSPLHHRRPGLPGAAISDARVVCTLIADGRHVHPDVLDLVCAKLGPRRMALITDAISAAGMGEGEYTLAGRRVYLRDGVPELADGTLAGSVLTMDEALRNIIAFTGCTLPEAVMMASTTPARLVGARGKGVLSPGADADIVALSPELEVVAVWKGGALRYGSP